jgi:hypothetical protein
MATCRDFTTEVDFFAVFNKLVEKGDFAEFLAFAFTVECDGENELFHGWESGATEKFYSPDLIEWLLSQLPDGTMRMCQLVANAIKEGVIR